MSRYSRDDPRSIFFSGTSTPLRSYAGSDLFKFNPPSPSPGPSTSTAAATPPPPPATPASTDTDPPKPEPVVRIIPILYPAQPARLIGGTSTYGNTRPPPEGDGSSVKGRPDISTATPPPVPPTTPSTAGPSTAGILKAAPPAGPAPSSGSGPGAPRVSFELRPTPVQPMAGPSGVPASGSGSAPSNGVHARPILKPQGRGTGEEASGEPPVPVVTSVLPADSGPSCRMQLALYGWRKKCLYALIFILTVMIIVNLALTLWIMKVMEFSSNGMGQLKIVPGGIQLTGQALVLNTLRASSIRSKHGQPISVESSRNLSVNTRNAYGAIENQLFLGHDRLEVLANHFRITDTHGTNLFAVDRDEVIVGAGSLRVEGEGGVAFRDSIQTPLVRADAGKDLRLESPTRSLEARATQEIFIQSRAGGIETTCLNDLKLHSVAGSIRLDSSAIYMPNLRTVQTSSTSGGLAAASRGESAAKIYQLCACSSGKLFLAAPGGVCAADDTAICR
ncbi:delta-sarcoglycan [Anopheles nili]|uniref:delta-sarcoglycan n=1 Tax=Anopheles nili TaxID=185578 RepID=UPI00237B9C44|nr:delta-sarcoglycan [Anopheles nili]